MITTVEENGRVVELQEKGETVWSREEEKKKIKSEVKSEVADAFEQGQGSPPKKVLDKLREKKQR